MRNALEKSMNEQLLLEMIYVTKEGELSKRKVLILAVKEHTFTAYCHLRRAKRTFCIDQVLAAFPVRMKERAAM